MRIRAPFVTVSFAMVMGVAFCVAAAELETVAPGDFSQSYLEPNELGFSDARMVNSKEEGYAEKLADLATDPEERLAAAQALWRGMSRRHATEVLQFLAGPPPGGEAFRAFQRKVEADLQPAAILAEMSQRDYRWGAWLAFLRPHPDFVPLLMANLDRKSELLPETMLALGNSGDQRALKPLIQLLESRNHRTAGDAARALGYLGNAEAEPKLIESLASENGWLQVMASRALGVMGTQKALPALERLAHDDSFTGALNIHGCAARAIESIKKRHATKAVANAQQESSP